MKKKEKKTRRKNHVACWLFVKHYDQAYQPYFMKTNESVSLADLKQSFTFSLPPIIPSSNRMADYIDEATARKLYSLAQSCKRPVRKPREKAIMSTEYNWTKPLLWGLLGASVSATVIKLIRQQQ